MKIDKLIKRYKKFTIIALLPLVLLPLLLKFSVGYYADSISAFFYTSAKVDFIILLTVSAMMYIVDGVVSNKWYQILNGLALLGVAKFGHIDYNILHYVCASYFFIGNAFAIAFYSSTCQRWFKILGVFVFVVLPFFLNLQCNIITTLYAEWIALIFFIAHHIAEVNNKID